MINSLLDIKPVKHETYNCFFNNIIASVFQYWNKDVRLSFLDSFAISLYIENGEYEINCSTENFNYVLQEICGININRFKMNSNAELENYIKNYINNFSPIGISIDSYYLPWNINYLSQHRTHNILIIGYDSNNYYCVDGFSSMEVEKLSKVVIWNHYIALSSFDNNKDVTIDKHIVFKSLQCTASAYNNVIDILNYIQVDLSKDISMMIEPARSNVLYTITNIGWSRINFFDCLNMLKNSLNLDCLDDILIDINSCCENWIIIKNLVTKSLIYNDFQSCYDKMQKYLPILDKEEKKVINALIHIK